MWEKQESEMGFWNPVIGNEIMGEVTEITIGQYGKQITLKKADGSLIKTPSHKVLQAKLSKITVGDKVKIVYVKEDLPKLKGQQGARIYDVFIEKVTQEKVN